DEKRDQTTADKAGAASDEGGHGGPSRLVRPKRRLGSVWRATSLTGPCTRRRIRRRRGSGRSRKARGVPTAAGRPLRASAPAAAPRGGRGSPRNRRRLGVVPRQASQSST